MIISSLGFQLSRLSILLFSGEITPRPTFIYGSAKSTASALSGVTVKFASIRSTFPVSRYSTLFAASVLT